VWTWCGPGVDLEPPGTPVGRADDRRVQAWTLRTRTGRRPA